MEDSKPVDNERHPPGSLSRRMSVSQVTSNLLDAASKKKPPSKIPWTYNVHLKQFPGVGYLRRVSVETDDPDLSPSDVVHHEELSSMERAHVAAEEFHEMVEKEMCDDLMHHQMADEMMNRQMCEGFPGHPDPGPGPCEMPETFHNGRFDMPGEICGDEFAPTSFPVKQMLQHDEDWMRAPDYPPFQHCPPGKHRYFTSYMVEEHEPDDKPATTYRVTNSSYEPDDKPTTKYRVTNSSEDFDDNSSNASSRVRGKRVHGIGHLDYVKTPPSEEFKRFTFHK